MRFIFLARGFRTGKRVVVLCGRAEQRSKPISSWKLGSQFSQPLQQPACRLFCSLALRECFFLPTREWKTLVERRWKTWFITCLSGRLQKYTLQPSTHVRVGLRLNLQGVEMMTKTLKLWLIRLIFEPPGAIFGKIETMEYDALIHLSPFPENQNKLDLLEV